MQKYYPDVRVLTPDLYDSKIGGLFVKLYEQKGYQNTCAVRMSYGLNRSGAKLAKAASGAREALIYSGGWDWQSKKRPGKAQTAAIPRYGEDLQRSRAFIFGAKTSVMNKSVLP